MKMCSLNVRGRVSGISVKVLRTLSMFTATALLCSSSMQSAVFGQQFRVKQYDEFHHVLHPLEHEALPNRDFRSIRAKANRLVKLGKTIVKVGVPAGIAETYLAEFRKELKKFNDALARLSKDAKAGNDAQLEQSFSAVHDSFEMLAAMLPRR